MVAPPPLCSAPWSLTTCLCVHLLNLFLLPLYNHHSKHYSTYSTSMLISTTSYALLPYNHHSKHHSTYSVSLLISTTSSSLPRSLHPLPSQPHTHLTDITQSTSSVVNLVVPLPVPAAMLIFTITNPLHSHQSSSPSPPFPQPQTHLTDMAYSTSPGVNMVGTPPAPAAVLISTSPLPPITPSPLPPNHHPQLQTHLTVHGVLHQSRCEPGRNVSSTCLCVDLHPHPPPPITAPPPPTLPPPKSPPSTTLTWQTWRTPPVQV